MAQEVTTGADFMQAGGMFVIELTYKAPLAEIDAHMKAHVVFLKKYYAAGHFLVSGRQIPREGGIILAIGESRQQIETIMSEDPFCRQGLADFRVVEFRASQSADDMPKRIGA
ncbi:MAG TPA: YciI family protein [Polyangiaceae bacterium]|nr:YciI family protein [Polyangiaceae bacterium]